MEITCQACSTKLNIPDAALPKGVPMVKGACPKCQAVIEIKLGAPAPTPAPTHVPEPAAAAPTPTPPPPPPAPEPEAAAPASAPTNGHSEAAAPPPAPVPAPPPVPVPAPAPMVLDDEFVEGQRLAMVCFSEEKVRGEVKGELETLGYAVHAPSGHEEALARLRKSKYEVLLMHEDFGGGEVLKAVAPMPMPMRRHMCVGLVGKSFRTMDNMTAFSKSVNFVAAEKELAKIKSICRHAIMDNDQFYAAFREALKEANKA